MAVADVARWRVACNACHADACSVRGEACLSIRLTRQVNQVQQAGAPVRRADLHREYCVRARGGRVHGGRRRGALARAVLQRRRHVSDGRHAPPRQPRDALRACSAASPILTE